MSELTACDCIVKALVAMSTDPKTELGRYFACRPHEQMIVWDGLRWRWSNQREDIEAADESAAPV